MVQQVKLLFVPLASCIGGQLLVSTVPFQIQLPAPAPETEAKMAFPADGFDLAQMDWWGTLGSKTTDGKYLSLSLCSSAF